VRVSLAVFELEVDGRVLGSSTRAVALGARTVALSTAVPGLALDLHTTYLGAAGPGTHAAHLVLSRELSAHHQLDHPAGELSLDVDREALVLDHAATLQAAAETAAGAVVLLRVDDACLEELLRRGVAPSARGPGGKVPRAS